MTLLSYHNDPAVKAKYAARFAAHRAADEVIQGHGFENGRGCFVGCTLNNYSHQQFETELGWPTWLAHLADAIFEGLPATDAPQFGTDLLEAAPVGVSLEPARLLFLLAIQKRNLKRMVDAYANVQDVIMGAIRALESLPASDSAQAAVWSLDSDSAGSTRSAVLSAVWSLDSDSAGSTRSAAQAAAQAASDSAQAAVLSVRSVRSDEYKLQRDDLLSILQHLKESK